MLSIFYAATITMSNYSVAQRIAKITLSFVGNKSVNVYLRDINNVSLFTLRA